MVVIAAQARGKHRPMIAGMGMTMPGPKPTDSATDENDEVQGFLLEGDLGGLNSNGLLLVDGSAEFLEGLVDEEELAELRAYALDAARARRAAAVTPTQPKSPSATSKSRES